MNWNDSLMPREPMIPMPGSWGASPGGWTLRRAPTGTTGTTGATATAGTTSLSAPVSPMLASGAVQPAAQATPRVSPVLPQMPVPKAPAAERSRSGGVRRQQGSSRRVAEGLPATAADAPVLWLQGQTAEGRALAFELQPGAIVQLRGGSVATQQGLLAAACAQPGGGHCRILGLDTRRLSAMQRRVLRTRFIASVVAGDRLDADLSVLDNVALALHISLPRQRGRDGDAMRAALVELDALGLCPLLQRLPAELDAAQTRLVLLARALVTRRRLVVLDQPEWGLSSAQLIALRVALWTAATQHGCSLLMCTQQPRLAAMASLNVDLD